MRGSSKISEAQESLDQARQLLENPNLETIRAAAIQLERAIVATSRVGAPQHPTAEELGRFRRSLDVVAALIEQGSRFHGALAALVNPPGEGYTAEGGEPPPAATSGVVLEG